MKFTREGREGRRQRQGWGEPLEVAVRDDGVAVEPAALALVFEPFVQTESGRGHGRGGLGLGLALLKGFVEAHGGSVRADSQGRIEVHASS